MKYTPQSPNACLAYAALSIGAVDREAVEVYEKALRASGLTTSVVDNWSRNYIPWYTPVIDRMAAGVVGRYVKDISPMNGKPVGTGIATIVANGPGNWSAINHAIAYSRGRYMDPEPKGPGIAETWEELKARYESEGYTDVKLIDYARAR